MRTSPIFRLSPILAASVFTAFIGWSAGGKEPTQLAAVSGDAVRVILRNGQQREFTPAADTDAARGDALVSALAWVNDLARKAAEDGCVFRGALVSHSDGNFYGMTTVGGANDRAGVIFQLGSNGRYRVIHHFTSVTGTNPRGALVVGPDGALYGTAEGGGSEGYGVVFRVTTAGGYSVLHHFNKANGAYPLAPLCLSSDGRFYGTTPHGGANDRGVLFRISLSGEFALLHSFAEADGSQPTSGLVEMGGALYGVTSRGGGPNGWGTVFQLGVGGAFNVLHTFSGVDGAYPFGALCASRDGLLYGTTFSGGAGFVNTTGLKRAYGTVFKISVTGSFTSIHSFDPLSGGGQHPMAGLVAASDGFLYGTTREGGRLNRGTVFRLLSNGRVQVIKNFQGDDGYLPSAPLVEGRDGFLYGTTQLGGGNDAGAIFRLLKNGGRPAVLRHAPMPGAGAQVLIGQGTYDISSVLYLRGSDIQLLGSGMEKTVLRRADGSNANNALVQGIYYSGLAGGRFIVSDLTVDSNLQGQSVPVNAGCVGLIGSDNVIRRVRAINWGSRLADECFALATGSSGGGELNDQFILGEGHRDIISSCVVDTPAPVVHVGGVTAISNSGGSVSTYSLPGNGWNIKPIIENCTVRGPLDPAMNPVHLQAYSISASQGGVVRNNLAENLVVGFYHDTGSIFNASIHNNRFLGCPQGVVFSLGTTTAVFQRDILIHDNVIECPPEDASTYGVTFGASNLSEIHNVSVLRNQIQADTGVRFESALPITGVRIMTNVIDATAPWSLTNVQAPIILNNRNSAGQPLP